MRDRFKRERGGARAEDAGPLVGIGILLLVVILVICAIFGWPFKKTDAGQIALSYGGGLFEGAQYQRTVQPGSGNIFNGWFDDWYEYPTTVRNYIVSERGDGDTKVHDVIVASTKDRVEVGYQLTVGIMLNTDKAQEFHKKLGLKYDAWTTGGWDKMFNDHVRKPLETSITGESKNVFVDDLYNGEALRGVEQAVGSTLKDRVSELAGGEFFCGVGYKPAAENNGKTLCPDFQVQFQRPVFSEKIVESFEDQKVSANGLVTAENEADQRAARADGIQRERDASAQAINDPNYIEFLRVQAMAECAKKESGCTLVITNGAGAGVNVNTGSGG